MRRLRFPEILKAEFSLSVQGTVFSSVLVLHRVDEVQAVHCVHHRRVFYADVTVRF
jgi:hypothetical protein